LGTAILGVLLWYLWSVNADYEQNDSAGYFFIDMESELGLSKVVDIQIQNTHGRATLSGSATLGYMDTAPITPSSFTAWKQIEFTSEYSNN